MIFDVLYYWLFRYYSKYSHIKDPHARTVFILGFIISIIIFNLLSLITAICFDFVFVYSMLGIYALVYLFLYFYYCRSGKGKYIVKELKPEIGNSRKKTNIAVTVFLIIWIIMMFLGIPLVMNILELHFK